MSHSLGGTGLLNMGHMDNTNLLNSGDSTGATSTPSLSPDIAISAGSSSSECPSPMSHSPNDQLNSHSTLLGLGSNTNNNNTLVQSPHISDKHSTRSHSPSNSVGSSVSTKSSATNCHSTPTRQYNNNNNNGGQCDTTLTNGNSGSNAEKNAESSVDNNVDAGNTSSDDYSDEIKVYNEEGAAEEEQRNSEDLKEEKTEIIKQTIDEKPSTNHPFSINNLFNFSGAGAAGKANAAANPFGNNPFAAAAAFGAFNQQRQASLFNPAALYSQELANHFASWWPAAAAGASFNPYNSASGAFNPFNAFNAAAANYQQQAAAAAVFQAAAASRFSPSLFLPPPPGSNASGTSSPKSEPSSHSASSSASSTSSSSSGSSAYSAGSHLQAGSPFSGSSSSGSSRFGSAAGGQNIGSPHGGQFGNKGSAKKKNYENYHHGSAGGAGPHGIKMEHHGHNMHQMNPNQNGLSQHNHYKPDHMAAPVPHVMVKEKPKKPHVKKPLNAFMLFMKEQRAAVVSECTLRESAAINQILGRKWHELERTEQAKYYEKARLARLEHMQANPGWSARDNYGLKKKRRRKREKVIGENGELPRKCRARYGLHQLHLWCKPCRRKKKCIRFAGQEDGAPGGGMMGANAQFMGEPGSGGSMNGGNSDDDYDAYEDDSEEETDDESEDEHEPGQPSQPNKMPHLMNAHGGPGGGHFNHGPGNLMQNHYQQQLQQSQQYQAMQHNSHLLNNHLLKQMNNQRNSMQGELDSKAHLHHQLRLNQEPI